LANGIPFTGLHVDFRNFKCRKRSF